MRRHGVVLSAMLALACTSRLSVGTDAGGENDAAANDAATLADTSAHDAFTPHDAGAGGCSVTVSSTDWPALPTVCLPRCSAATLSTVAMCMGDGTCVGNALRADTTSPTTLSVNGMDQSLTCVACYTYQQSHCAFQDCPSETIALDTCASGGGACTSEQSALQSCLGMHMTTFGDCANTEISRCFP